MSNIPNMKEYDNNYKLFTRSFNTFITKLVNKINTLTTKTVKFSETACELTLQDNTIYKYDGSDGISELTIKYPNTDFIATIIFATKSSGDIKVKFPEGTLFVGHINLEFFNREYWELNIHNGVVTAAQLFEK